MINVINISKKFGTQVAVQNTSLHVEARSIFGLVGPDGAGKTTFIRLICGLLNPDCGEVYLMNTSPEHINKQDLGYMPQRFSLYGDLTVMENLLFFGSMYKINKKTILSRADEILSITSLNPFRSRLADRLSGGMKQKLALTCSLITRPQLLILDEPTYGVDPESRKEFWKILYRLNQEGMTIFCSTAYMDEAELCHKVGFINLGNLVIVDSPAALKSHLQAKVLEVRAKVRDPHIFDNLEGVVNSSFFGYKYKLLVNNLNAATETIQAHLSNNRVELISLDEIAPTMEDLFISLAEKKEVANGLRD